MSAPPPPHGGDVTGEIAALRAELTEAKRIGTWLYEHLSPGARRALGDTGEWPWLAPAVTPADEALRPADLKVLCAFAELQADGEDPYDAAEELAATLRLDAQGFDGVVYRLIHGGYVTGGKLPSRTYVESVTEKGIRAAVTSGNDVPVLPAD